MEKSLPHREERFFFMFLLVSVPVVTVFIRHLRLKVVRCATQIEDQTWEKKW